VDAADGVDPLAPLVQFDSAVVERKPDAVVRAAAALRPRALADLLDGVPEARGSVVRNLAEDCTLHAH
jgi:hypothetical protein